MKRLDPKKLPDAAYMNSDFGFSIDDLPPGYFSSEKHDRPGSGLEAFFRTFSLAQDYRTGIVRKYPKSGFVDHTIGLLADPKCLDELDKRLASADTAIYALVREILGDQDISDWGVLQFLFKMRKRFSESRNPLWAWLSFDIHVQVGLPPPAWVWRYMAEVAFLITNAAAIPRRLTKHGDKKYGGKVADEKYRNEAVISALGLTRDTKTRDHVDKFRQDISEYRLALRVSNFSTRDSEKTKGRTGIMNACEYVAKQEIESRNASDVRGSRKSPAKQEIRTETNRIFKAHRRWFHKPKLSGIQ